MAYAALVSVSQTLEQILDSDPYFFPCSKKKVESFQETIASLIAFLDNCPPICTQTVHDLTRQIRDSAYEVEDVFESLLATHFLQKYGSDNYEKFKVFPQSFEKVMEDMESIKKKVKKIHQDGSKAREPMISTPTSSSRPVLRDYNTKMVALDNDLRIKLMEQLVGERSKVDVVPIVGMGGVGKTTLARILFDSKLITEAFDVCGWATVSQTYNVRKIALDILKGIGEHHDGRNGGEQDLYQSLYGRKYLIVLDDVWDTKAWDNMKKLFPENNNGSRVILTTRHSKVAAYANSSGSYHEMQLLNEDSSWSLLCREIFPQPNCPPELVEIGKEIARQCQGLPLAISAISGHLKKEEHTEKYWKYVSENVSSVLKTTDDPSLEILTLSYNYLPHHLKACFLYFGSFQDVHSIDVFRLLKLWVAEGFVRPSRLNSMDEIAEEYLRDVIERNLVFVSQYDRLGKPKSCGIHDLFRDMCIREAKKEEFLFTLSKDALFDHAEIDSQRRLILGPDIMKDYDRESLVSSIVTRNGGCSATRSFTYHDDGVCSPEVTPASGLLKVLRSGMSPRKFPAEILELVNLKYLELGSIPEIPSSISRLRNLQTIIANHIDSMPPETWELTQLRHLKSISSFDLPDIPDVQGRGTDMYILENIQTLSKILDFRCTQEVVTRIPNLKTLRIVYYDDVGRSSQHVINLVRLCKLESLHCQFDSGLNDHILRNLAFPFSLKQLVLMFCEIPWEKMTIIGILPNLEVLKLKYGAMKGKFWRTNDGEFKELKFLHIKDSEIVKWETEEDHFPSIQHIILEDCHDLEGIPAEIGNIPTLEIIELICCSDATECSAQEMFEEDSDIKLKITGYDSYVKTYKL